MRRASPALIGAFILGALLLAVGGVVILGSGKFFTETMTCLMYFDGAIQGLRVGASVNFRGVKVGTVTDIRMQLDRKNLSIRIPVYVEFPKGIRGSMEMINEGPRVLESAIGALIRRGLRAQLQTESLVTGQLFIQLDIYPVPVAFSEVVAPEAQTAPSPTGCEIPTVPTTLQEVSNTARKALDKLAELPLEAMLKAAQEALFGVNNLVNNPDIPLVLTNLNRTLVALPPLIQHTDTSVQQVATRAVTTLDQVQKVMAELQPLVQQTQRLVQQTQTLVQQVDQQSGPVFANAATSLGHVTRLAQTVEAQVKTLTTSLTQTSVGALGALEQMRETITEVQNLFLPNAPLGYEMTKALRELAETARSLRVLTDYLERHPNAVIFGRKERGGP